MLAVPPELTHRYEAQLAQQNLMAGQRPHYRFPILFVDYYI